jgi:MFS family permease
MTLFSAYRFNKPAEVEMIVWMTLIAVLAWLLGGSIGGLLADRWILENDYPRKRSTLAIGGFFTAFAICIASSIFIGAVNTIAIL